MSRNRTYDLHGTDDLVETEHEQLARICGLPVDVVAAAFDRPAGGTLPPEPIPGVIRTDDELERVQARIERGERAESELMYRALRRDFPAGCIDDDLDAA